MVDYVSLDVLCTEETAHSIYFAGPHTPKSEESTGRTVNS